MGWFDWGANSRAAKAARKEEREAERAQGRVKRTRRMEGDEGLWWGPTAAAQGQGQEVPVGMGMGGTPSRAGPSRGTRSQRARADEPVAEPLD